MTKIIEHQGMPLPGPSEYLSATSDSAHFAALERIVSNPTEPHNTPLECLLSLAHLVAATAIMVRDLTTRRWPSQPQSQAKRRWFENLSQHDMQEAPSLVPLRRSTLHLYTYCTVCEPSILTTRALVFWRVGAFLVSLFRAGGTSRVTLLLVSFLVPFVRDRVRDVPYLGEGVRALVHTTVKALVFDCKSSPRVPGMEWNGMEWGEKG